MALLRFWNPNSSKWEAVGDMSPPQPYLSESGGTVTGRLTVYDTLTVSGKIHAEAYFGDGMPESCFTGNIAMRGRTAKFGDSYISGVRLPTSDDDLANFEYLEDMAAQPQGRALMSLTSNWENVLGVHPPLSAAQSADGLVSLSGVVRVLSPMAPGGAGSMISNVVPGDMKPATRRVFQVPGQNAAEVHRVDVLPTGETQFVSGPAVVGPGYWLSFNDICFYPN